MAAVLLSEAVGASIRDLPDMTPWQAAHLYILPAREAARRAQGKGPDATLMAEADMPDPTEAEFVGNYMMLGATEEYARAEWARQTAARAAGGE